MKNSERHIKKKKSDTKKSYLISYYQERVASFSDKIYRDIKNRVIEATSKKEKCTHFNKYKNIS